ncbi:iron chelate uptake ABC transporter family permease subunit [Candidatus Thiothrix anitrata]|jgi:zinc transport system permease protein|uniref:High-affinity zinc uptake system membrane protein ZnuB n=1 Tax=Candidatus Thiothrix anitrata TaxID=2823902 RepID=A0ABX7X8D4_9GAMM|nr:iron chelate uptake ABC transporter family permease subunit [Candidatus Thiothrix anitrata]QTR51345.1 metal ABC transporter permease [Candidatus Thiothrix anitrata]
MDDFIVRALLAGVAVVLMGGVLGVFLLWRRMAYFGDTLAHSALLGVALGLMTGMNVNGWIILVCVLVALLMLYVQYTPALSSDTLLSIIGHSALALGMVALAFLPDVRVDLMGYLFGDILAVTRADLGLTWGMVVLVLGIMVFLWRSLLAIAVHAELAQVEGVRVWWVSAAYMVLVALMVAVAMKVVGVLLLTALLIIPAAAARRFARTPEQMAVFAVLLGCLALSGGMWASLQWDTPTGPSIVVVASMVFVLVQLVPRRNT